MTTKIEIEPIRKSVSVDSRVDRAFTIFTDGMTSWWPLERYSVGAEREDAAAEAVVLEGREGGRLYERMSDGTEADWGEVLVWEPPHRLVVTWHPGYDEPSIHTEIEVRFSADGDRTRASSSTAAGSAWASEHASWCRATTPGGTWCSPSTWPARPRNGRQPRGAPGCGRTSRFPHTPPRYGPAVTVARGRSWPASLRVRRRCGCAPARSRLLGCRVAHAGGAV